MSSAKSLFNGGAFPVQIQSNTKQGCRNRGQRYGRNRGQRYGRKLCTAPHIFPIRTNLHQLAFNPRAQLNRPITYCTTICLTQRNCHVFTKEPQQLVVKIFISFQGGKYNSENCGTFWRSLDNCASLSAIKSRLLTKVLAVGSSLCEGVLEGMTLGLLKRNLMKTVSLPKLSHLPLKCFHLCAPLICGLWEGGTLIVQRVSGRRGGRRLLRHTPM